MTYIINFFPPNSSIKSFECIKEGKEKDIQAFCERFIKKSSFDDYIMIPKEKEDD